MSSTETPPAEPRMELAEEVRLRGMRSVIARRMTESLHGMAQLTLHRSVEVERLVELRRSLGEQGPNLNALVMTTVARTLSDAPAVNATLEDGVISRWRTVNLGMAVALDEGLVVPVIRDAHTLSLAAISDEIRRLGERAQQGALTPEEMAEGTFTVTNLGAFGVEGFTPIVNPPQVAILGVGALRRGQLTLSLTIDHRALDGAPGARFLAAVAERLEDPTGLVVDGVSGDRRAEEGEAATAAGVPPRPGSAGVQSIVPTSAEACE